ncbi:hypothetical protein [Mammaliicoccus sp. J-M41]|uniref:hypothetical protein n=1 Tax=Mammaliicoccus sp. J-M41 TaxID=2898700 RepID=UPI001EFC0473|nr:hypothetical protein [Mammaliicoccus sp. J-M41]
MRKSKAKKFQEEFNSLGLEFKKVIRDMLDKETNGIHLEEATYSDIYDIVEKFNQYHRVMIEVCYNDFASKKDKINVYELTDHTEEEKKYLEKVKEKFYYSKDRYYIESSLIRLEKQLDFIKKLKENNKFHDNYDTRVKCRKKIKLENSLEAIGDTVGKVFKKAIIPAVSKGASLAKEGYYTGMDELGKKADTAYENFYKEMKSKPTSTLLDYYNNRELNDYQFSIIEEVLVERGAL